MIVFVPFLIGVGIGILFGVIVVAPRGWFDGPKQ